MIPRIWDAWVVLLYYTSFASPCGLFSRCAVVISWKNQPCVVVSTSFKWRQILCLTGISDIKLQRRKSTDLWETLHGHMHWMERALGTKNPFGLICKGENKKLLWRDPSVLGKKVWVLSVPRSSCSPRAVSMCCQHPPTAVAVCWCVLVAFSGLMGARLEPTRIADVS